MKVNMFAYFSGHLGYNVHAQGMAEGMIENGIDLRCVLEEQRPDQNTLCSAVVESAQKGYSPDSTSIRLGYGNDMYNFHGKRRIGLTVWETTKIPKTWVQPLNELDGLWTVSKHSKKSLENSGVDQDIKIVNEGVDTSVFAPFVKPAERPQDEFVFLSVFKWEKRKSPIELVQAFAEEFRSDEKVRLLMQCYNPFMQNMNPYEILFGLNLPQHAPIRIIPPAPKRSDLARYYKTADCFVFPTRGESWGLPVIESMAVGVPVITTNWGGTPEFMTKDYGWLIDVEKMEEPNDGMFFKPDMFERGNEWAVPSKKHLRELMRYAFEHKDECLKKGAKAAEHVDKNYSWEEVTKVTKKLLK